MTIRAQKTKRSPDDPMGRFGGGWQWKLGIQANSDFSCVIVNLITFYVRITVTR